MARRVGGLPLGGFIAVVGAAAVLIGGTATAAVVVGAASKPPPPAEAKPGQDIFEALRLTDSDVGYLGLSASDGGHTPSTLATAVTRVASDWRDIKGTPTECMFAGEPPGASVYPVWGTETATDPFWTEKTISATQTLSQDGISMINLTARTFVNEQGALDFLLAHNDAVPGCPSFTSAIFQGEVTTKLTPLLVNTLQVSNTGWVAETDGWVDVGMPATTAMDLQCWVLNLQHGNVVERMTMLVPADSEADAGPFFTELAGVVAAKLAATVEG